MRRRMRKMRKELQIGLLINALFLVLNRFTEIPHLILGIIFGVGVSLMLVGSLSDKRYTALIGWKRSLFKSR